MLNLTGTTASKGKAKGRIRVLLNKDEYPNFQEGEILVTKETTPELVPVMRKAKAIITVKGGILCHAAIIARELQIPCLVGVNKALEQLKTGDEVEVDADKGEIVVFS